LTRIPPAIDMHLRELAEHAAGPNPWPLLNETGWSREEFVAAIHARLRDKWREREAVVA
jgi:hypothetical protein